MNENLEYPITICSDMADISTRFEKNNSMLKTNYYIKNIQMYNSIVKSAEGFRGTFGTGYPFYALDGNLSEKLPIIDEQIRYNEELKQEVQKSGKSIWTCGLCLKRNESIMPDLKQVCKPCPRMVDGLKPRKVINRLPDVDMWTICDDNKIEENKKRLAQEFKNNHYLSSDINPTETFKNVEEIVTDLEQGKMPFKYLPLDAHIVGYSDFVSLVAFLPYEMDRAHAAGEVPYLPIHPWSYRKDWQKDDVAYNFIFDYLYSLTEFECDPLLKYQLTTSRNQLVNKYGVDYLYDTVLSVSSDSVKRRLKTKEVQSCLKERLSKWKK